MALGAVVVVAGWTGLDRLSPTYQAIILIAGAWILAVALLWLWRWWKKSERPDPSETYYSRRTIYLPDLVRGSGHPSRLQDKLFEDCELVGPAILVMMDGDHNSLEQVTINSPYSPMKSPVETAYKVSFDRPTPGTIGCRGVTLRRCTLTWVAVIGEGQVGKSLAEARRTVSNDVPSEQPDSVTRESESVATVSEEDVAADSIAPTSESGAAPAPVLPPSLAAIPEVGKEVWLKEMRTRHTALTVSGIRFYEALWMLSLSQAESETEKRRHERQGDVWLQEVQRFAGTYWGDEGATVYHIRKMTELNDTAAGQQPPWRALLSQKLMVGREWLDSHKAPDA